jgi:hypothetical protein
MHADISVLGRVCTLLPLAVAPPPEIPAEADVRLHSNTTARRFLGLPNLIRRSLATPELLISLLIPGIALPVSL